MCDTFVATPDFTAAGSMILGKNSDREPNEAQALLRLPRRETGAKEVQATYISVPQVPETNEVLLSKPFQMWGAEMGVNEHGLAIGNEAVFTKIKLPKTNGGLTGMDMLRMALERVDSAERALELISGLVEAYSQDACGGYTDKNFYYHSSFLIADAREAFVLETAGHQWAAQRVRGFRSISNGLTIEHEWDFASKGLIDFARKQGWVKSSADFNFRRAYSERFLTYFSKCAARRALSSRAGEKASGRLDAAGAMAILRSHGDHDAKGFHPARSDMASLCLHATGLTTPSQTTGSMVAELRADRPDTFWFTGTASPCLSTFKPFFIPGRTVLEDDFPQPGGRADDSLWWRHERVHRRALKNYPEVSALFRDERDLLERDFLAEEARLLAAGGPDLNRALENFSRASFEQYNAKLAAWLERVESGARKTTPFAPLYRSYWRRQNAACGLPGI